MRVDDLMAELTNAEKREISLEQIELLAESTNRVPGFATQPVVYGDPLVPHTVRLFGMKKMLGKAGTRRITTPAEVRL